MTREEHLKEMKNQRLSIDDLVRIGDAIHDSYASFIFTAHSPITNNEDHHLFGCMHGSTLLIKNMLAEAFQKREVLELVVEAIKISAINNPDILFELLDKK